MPRKIFIFSDLREIERLAGDESKAKLQLLGEYDPKGHRIVPDPYYEEGTEMFQQASSAFIHIDLPGI